MCSAPCESSCTRITSQSHLCDGTMAAPAQRRRHNPLAKHVVQGLAVTVLLGLPSGRTATVWIAEARRTAKNTKGLGTTDVRGQSVTLPRTVSAAGFRFAHVHISRRTPSRASRSFAPPRSRRASSSHSVGNLPIPVWTTLAYRVIQTLPLTMAIVRKL